MRTLHFGLRVSDLERSLAFYAAVGYQIVGNVPETELGELTMIKLPDDPFVTVELVSGADHPVADHGGALSHLVIQVESLDETISALAANGIDAEAPGSPDGSDDIRTTWITDPDDNRIELVQWAAGHPVGMTAADWPE